MRKELVIGVLSLTLAFYGATMASAQKSADSNQKSGMDMSQMQEMHKNMKEMMAANGSMTPEQLKAMDDCMNNMQNMMGKNMMNGQGMMNSQSGNQTN